MRRNASPVVDRASVAAVGRRLRGPPVSRISSSALRQSSAMARNRGPAQRRGQPPDLAGAAPGQEGPERLQVGRGRGLQLPGHRVEAEQVHVQVPDRRGHVAQPLELGLVMLREFVREDRAEQLDGRTGAADRDPQVVQELGIDVAEHAVDVGLHGVEQP